MANADFQPHLVTLWRETFEGIKEGADGTWFVQGKEGLFDALSNVTAEQASAKPTPNGTTIAAHVNHIRFALQLAHHADGGPKPEGTWESSWDVQTMTPEEWAQAAKEIKAEYDFILNWLATNQDWSNQETFTYAMSLTPHMAYHLGAIRQIMRQSLSTKQ